MSILDPTEQRRLAAVEALTPLVDVTPGEPATIEVRLTNLDNVIRAFDVTVFGVDPDWITVSGNASNSPQTISVSLTVTQGPVITLSTSSLNIGIA